MSAHEANYSHAQRLRATIFDMADGEQRRSLPHLEWVIHEVWHNNHINSAVISEGDADPASA